MIRSLVAAALAAAVLGAPAARAADDPDTAPAPAASPLAEARARIKAHDYAAALPLLERVLATAPDDADALNLKGFSLRKTGRREEALAFYQRALAIKPDHLGANEYLGELYVELRDLARARERLAVLAAACDARCEEYADLAAAIARAAP